MSALRLRPARPEDHPHVARWFGELGVDEAPPDAGSFERTLLPTTSIVEGEEGVLGYVFVQTLETSGYVRHLVVDGRARRRGVGRFVLETLRARFRAAGCTRWRLNVKPENTAARALYEAVGMREEHASRVVRFAWGLEQRLPAEPGLAAAPLADGDERAVEEALGLPAGLLRSGRATGKEPLVVRAAGGAPRGAASFDPRFPGAFPFLAESPEVARALLEACRARRGVIDDPAHPWRGAGMQVVADGEELADALVAAGGREVLRTLHYAGPL